MQGNYKIPQVKVEYADEQSILQMKYQKKQICDIALEMRSAVIK